MKDRLGDSGRGVLARALATATAAAIAAAVILVLLVLPSSCAGAPPAQAPGGAVSSGTAPAPAPPPATIPKGEPAKAGAAPPADAGAVRGASATPDTASGWADSAKMAEMAAPGTPAEARKPAPSTGAATSSGTPAPKAAPSQSGLKAGFSDDNEQFNLFVKFLDQYKDAEHFPLAVQERIVLKIKDQGGRAVANAAVWVKTGGRTLASGKTYADGSFSIYPLEYADKAAKLYTLEVSSASGGASLAVDRAGPRQLSLSLAKDRTVPAPLPVDILFVMDTTGSMGEEIERLRSTIEIINTNITALRPRPALRFGMVLYKDREDEYVTQVVPFTADLDAFQKSLDLVDASGGGDTPEDLQAALKDAVRGMSWNRDGLRMAFVVTDAPAHLDYADEPYTYADAAREAKAAGIKFFGIGTGGLPLEGEYLLRQLSQYSQGKYIFLTYGEAGEAAGGAEGSVSHHTGTNFTTDKLEAVVIRFVKEEISRQSDKSLEYDESYYAAQRVQDESREDTLGKLFAQALQGLSDYSTFRLTAATRCSIMPLGLAEGAPAGLAAQAEYFGAQLDLGAAKSRLFTLVERKDLQSILKELELQLSGLSDEGAAAKVGKLLGAEVLVTGTVYRKEDRYEIFLKLVRVESAEVLSATKARVDLKLGL